MTPEDAQLVKDLRELRERVRVMAAAADRVVKHLILEKMKTKGESDEHRNSVG